MAVIADAHLTTRAQAARRVRRGDLPARIRGLLGTALSLLALLLSTAVLLYLFAAALFPNLP